MRYLVTGGAGFIGSHIVSIYLFSSGKHENLPFAGTVPEIKVVFDL